MHASSHLAVSQHELRYMQNCTWGGWGGEGCGKRGGRRSRLLWLRARSVATQEWQSPALDALAAWLGEDAARLEPRLAQRDAIQRFVALFAGAAAAGDSEALARLLDSFLRILRRSPKVTVEVAEGGLGPLVAEMLRRASALTALNVLQLARALPRYNPSLSALASPVPPVPPAEQLPARLPGRTWRACVRLRKAACCVACSAASQGRCSCRPLPVDVAQIDAHVGALHERFVGAACNTL